MIQGLVGGMLNRQKGFPMIKNLVNIQNELKAPKSNFNSFGKYRYRSAEDILTAVKPILAKYNCQMTITDDIILIGTRYYIKATVTLSDTDGNTETVSAFAREDETKKGMDGPQIVGCASSYARKYALNGMFLIDDTKDADTDEYHKQTEMADSKPNKLTKAYLKEHGNDRIDGDMMYRLKQACINAGESMSLEKALKACKRDSIEEITVVQYMSLMSQLGAVA